MTTDEFMLAFGETRRHAAAEYIREKNDSNGGNFWELYLEIWTAIHEQYRYGEDDRLHPLQPLRR